MIRLSQWFIMLCLWLYCMSISDLSRYVSDCTVSVSLRRVIRLSQWFIMVQYVSDCTVPSTYAQDTCLMSISRFSLRDKVTLRLFKIYFDIVDVAEWSRELDIRLSYWCCSISMVFTSSNLVEGRTKICQHKDLILTLFGLIFRLYINV